VIPRPGLERNLVNIGQFVLKGAQVATMGRHPRLNSILATARVKPVLYIEFRKDGHSNDPGPWWAANEGERFADDAQTSVFSLARHKARNDSVVTQHAPYDGIECAAATSDNYRQLKLFRRCVSTGSAGDYVEKPDRQQLVDIRHQRHAGRGRPAFEPDGSQELRDMQVQDPRWSAAQGIEVTTVRRPDKVVLADR